MGLDMYLYSKYYVQNWGHTPPERRHEVSVLTGGKKSNIPVDKTSYVECQEVYWRKANHIHRWFVDNCQGGVDDCREAYVGLDKLKELLSICSQILENNSLAEELLPCQEGFFFGTYEYDEFYFNDVRFTRDELARVIGEAEAEGLPDSPDFYYHSSW